MAISNLLPKFSRDIAMATKLNLLYVNLVKTSSHMHCIFNIFVSAGGFKTMISDMLLKFTMEVAMAKKFYILIAKIAKIRP